MRTNTTLRNLFVLGFVSVIIYAVIDGIRAWGKPMGYSAWRCAAWLLFSTLDVHLSGNWQS
jgi:hypothetical protein